MLLTATAQVATRDKTSGPLIEVESVQTSSNTMRADGVVRFPSFPESEFRFRVTMSGSTVGIQLVDCANKRTW